MSLKRTLIACRRWLYVALLAALGALGGRAQSATPTPASAQLLDANGWTAEKLVENGLNRRADVLAARAKVAAAQARVTQANRAPNPTLEAEFGSPRLLLGDAESALAVTFGQTWETNGKRRKRTILAELELAQAQVAVRVLERQLAAAIRAAYARAVANGRQLDALAKLAAANEETLRIANERLKEGDVAPLDVSLLQVETDRLRLQIIRARAEAESEIIELRALAGLEQSEPLRLAPLPEKPPRLDASLEDLTAQALANRPDLQAARLGEQLGAARVTLAQAGTTPNVEGFVKFSRDRQLTDLPAALGPNLRASSTDNALTFGVKVELPNKKRAQALIGEAAAGQTQAQREREFLEAGIRRDVALAYRRYRAAAETVALYAASILPRAEANLRSVRAAYQLGEFSASEVVNEQRRLLENQTGYNDALRDYYGALAELESALGMPLPASGFAPGTTSVLPDEKLFVAPRPAVNAVAGPSAP